MDDIEEPSLQAQAVEALFKANEALEREVHERKKSEEALREAEQRYRSIFSETLQGIFQLQPTGHLLSVNPAMATFMGYDNPQDMMQCVTGPLWEMAVDPHLHDLFLAEIKKHGQILSHELLVYRKDRSKMWVSSSVRAIQQDGEIVRFVGIFEDITERKQLRARLLQAQKLESIGQLAAGIAHEINTPTQYIADNVRFLKENFGVLIGLTQHLQKVLAAAGSNNLGTDLLEQSAKLLETADLGFLIEEIPRAIGQSLEGVERVSTLVAAMKEFSKPGGKDKTAVDLNQSIRSTIAVTTNEWKSVAEVETRLDEPLPAVSGLPGEINQVLLHLIVNAAHAIADTQVKGSDRKGKIGIQTCATPGCVEIRVSDTGTGIPEKIRDRIFDPFFTTKEVGRGAGQGLAIARSVIVDKHGGSIDFETEVGKGTTFIIRLPRQASDPAGKQAA